MKKKLPVLFFFLVPFFLFYVILIFTSSFAVRSFHLRKYDRVKEKNKLVKLVVCLWVGGCSICGYWQCYYYYYNYFGSRFNDLSLELSVGGGALPPEPAVPPPLLAPPFLRLLLPRPLPPPAVLGDLFFPSPALPL